MLLTDGFASYAIFIYDKENMKWTPVYRLYIDTVCVRVVYVLTSLVRTQWNL